MWIEMTIVVEGVVVKNIAGRKSYALNVGIPLFGVASFSPSKGDFKT
jgi:hypothetical protein